MKIPAENNMTQYFSRQSPSTPYPNFQFSKLLNPNSSQEKKLEIIAIYGAMQIYQPAISQQNPLNAYFLYLKI